MQKFISFILFDFDKLDDLEKRIVFYLFYLKFKIYINGKDSKI